MIIPSLIHLINEHYHVSTMWQNGPKLMRWSHNTYKEKDTKQSATKNKMEIEQKKEKEESIWTRRSWSLTQQWVGYQGQEPHLEQHAHWISQEPMKANDPCHSTKPANLHGKLPVVIFGQEQTCMRQTQILPYFPFGQGGIYTQTHNHKLHKVVMCESL